MIWAIGDIQGCYEPFKRLLEKIDFNPKADQLWLVGDLVNRGNKSLETIDYIYENRNSIKAVLGNHDISLIAAYYGIKKPNQFIEPILKSKKVDKYIKWLKSLPFFYIDEENDYCLVHAGISPIFDINEAVKWNDVLQKKMQGSDSKKWLKNILDNRQNVLNYGVSEEEDEIYAFSSFIRMRYCFEDGGLEMENKSSPSSIEAIEHTVPWFNVSNRKEIDKKIIFGHWSTLGSYQDDNVVALDTGCVWGGSLTAFDLFSKKIVSVSCRKK